MRASAIDCYRSEIRMRLDNGGQYTIPGLASIIIVTYNHERFLDACLHSVMAQDYPHEVILVDNCSRDKTVPFVREHFPSVKVIESPCNSGYGAGNNLGVSSARGEYIVVLNPDTIVHDGWLSALVSPLKNQNNIITTPKILTYDGLEINTCGNINHFTGLTFTQGLGLNPYQYGSISQRCGISGACFAIKKDDYILLGGFDESFFVYNEDSDFSWRAYLLEYEIRFISDSILNHYYTLRVAPEKLYHLEIGRYLILRKYYTINDIVRLIPSLSIVELLTLFYALKLGKDGVKYKIKAMYKGITSEVSRIEGNKKSLMRGLAAQIPENQLVTNCVEREFLAVCNKIFNLNYRVFS
jgi:GT2 family glycosyltransferase